MQHRTAEFIVLYAGKLYALIHRPTDATLPIPYLYTEDLDYNFPCDERIEIMRDGDVPQSVKVLAKMLYDYDDNPAFTPERKSNIKKTPLWDDLERQMLHQNKQI